MYFVGQFKVQHTSKMNTIKSLLTKSSKKQATANAQYGCFQTGVLGQFNSPSIVDIFIANKNVTEVTFKDTVRTAGKLADQAVSLKIRDADRDDEEIDIVEEFIGEELDEFYAECSSLQEVIRKDEIEKAITNYLFKTWKILKMKLLWLKTLSAK
jgi:hypothetical protein